MLARLAKDFEPDKSTPVAAKNTYEGQKKRLAFPATGLTVQKAAELMVISVTAELIGITRRLNQNSPCSERVSLFCEKIVESEEDFLIRLRGFM